VPINYILKDPLAPRPLLQLQKKPRPGRGTRRAGFVYFQEVTEDLYQQGTAEFLFWQCREAALAAVEAWERLDRRLTQWSEGVAGRSHLDLLQNAGNDLNAYYDRGSLSFFQFKTGNKTTYSGASADVVAHETGHALLDAARPDLWNSPVTEVSAFHESFGDCMALLTALSEPAIRERLLLASPTLKTANFVETWGADLADGVKREHGSTHPSAEPRHALNKFPYQLPSALPASGSPAKLTREPHSFSRVFTGCFYDLICQLFNDQTARDEGALGMAAETAGRLLISAVRSVPVTDRLFQAVGRAMVRADQQAGGANAVRIKRAFAGHNIPLGEPAVLAPAAALAGAAPKFKAEEPVLDPDTNKDLRERINVKPHAKLQYRTIKMGAQKVAEVIHHREIPLGQFKLSEKLEGVVAVAPEAVLVGGAGPQAAVLGAFPEENATAEEVRAYVEMLVEHGRIAFDKPQDAGPEQTHTVYKQGKKKVLSRLRFLCRCGA
jgi:hypothetical protein